MPPPQSSAGTKRAGRFLRCLLAAAGALALAPSGHAAKYQRASLGRIDVLTSDSPEQTRRLVAEILEVRRQLQQLVAPLPLPDPRIQVVVFRTQQDFKEFIPPGGQPIGVKGDYETAGRFTADECGLTFSLVRDDSYTLIREVNLMGYATYLLGSAVPTAPLWISIGVPEFFSTTQYRKNKILLGEPARNHLNNIRAAKLIPLARLTDDTAMRAKLDTFNHDTALYHESWALWHQWLTDPNPGRREQVRRLLAAVRGGAPGDTATLSESFGQPLAEIEAAHRNRKTFGGFPSIVANPDADSLVAGLNFSPADDLDRAVAMALLLGRSNQGLGSLGYELLQHASAHPASPRPLEALAVLAFGSRDPEGGARYLERARELDTDLAYAYLLPVAERLQRRPFELTLRANLPEALVESTRGLLQRCLELNPGESAAQYYRSWVEAFAPEPRRDLVEEVGQSQAASLRPAIFLTQAIAFWRLGDRDRAHRLLAEHIALRYVGEDARKAARRIDEFMRAAEQAAR